VPSKPPPDSFEALLARPEVRAAIVRVLRRRGFRGEELDKDGPQEVLRKAWEWDGPRPTTLEGTIALCAKIACAHGVSALRKEGDRRELGDAGLTNDEDTVAALAGIPFDAADGAKLIELVRARLSPEMFEALYDLASGVPQRETAEARGVPYEKHRKDVEKARKRTRTMLVQWLGAGAGVAALVGALLLALNYGGDDGRVSAPYREPDAEATEAAAAEAAAGDAGERGEAERDRAARVRTRAAVACAAKRWEACLALLGDARAIDPAGAEAPEAKALERQARRGLAEAGMGDR